MKITRDDERARRICSLALAFMNATTPISSSDLAREFYPELEVDSMRRTFLRDREALAACGVIVDEVRVEGEESRWIGNENTSFSAASELEPLQAAALNIACRPLIENPSFPFTADLRLALAKLDRAFAEPLPGVVTNAGNGKPVSRKRSQLEATLRDAVLDCCLVEARYTDAKNNTSERLLAPLGMFSLDGRSYVVAGAADVNGALVDDGIRTYRVERFERVAPTATSFVVPADFDLADYQLLPFQIGTPQQEATFRLPASALGDKSRITLNKGQVDKDVWTVSVHDLARAASWALAFELTPLDPPELVDAWHKLIAEASSAYQSEVIARECIK